MEVIKKIWWLRAIYSDKKLLNMTFLANTDFSEHYKKKYNEIMKAALQKDFDQAKIIDQVSGMFPEPFASYLLNAPHILEFMKIHTEYSIFETYLNPEDLEGSLKTIFRKFSPAVEFARQSVNVMSIHKSKGLQADYVFISGLVDGVMPNKIQGLDTIEAQRRLLFVGMTRSMKQLYMISQVEWKGIYVHRMDKSQFSYDFRKKIYSGKASLFITEMTKNT